jgi:hypothetical protein
VAGHQVARRELRVGGVHGVAAERQRRRDLACGRQAGAGGQPAALDHRREVVGELPRDGHVAGAVGPERDVEHEPTIVHAATAPIGPPGGAAGVSRARVP